MKPGPRGPVRFCQFCQFVIWPFGPTSCRGGLLATGQQRSGAYRLDGWVDVKPHGGTPAVDGPDGFRTNPAQLCEHLERVANTPWLRQAGPGVAVHVASGERGGELPTGELTSQKRGRHASGVS